MNPDAARKIPVVSLTEQFSGRRRATRRVIVMPVACEGVSGTYAGRTLDLSRRGVLVELRDARFTRGAPSPTMLAFLRRASEEFGKGLFLRFGDLPLRVEARVRRVTRHPAGTTMLLGCEFLQALNERQCHALGVATDDTADPPT